MIFGMSIGAFILGVVWPGVALIGSLIYALVDKYEGCEVEKLCGEEFKDWYNTF